MASPDILFKGIPRGPTRGYTADVIRALQPTRVVIPCTGSFSLAYVARAAGVPPEQIVCGDISLYSTALGHAIMDRDWRLELADERAALAADYLDTPTRKAAAVLFMIRVLQYDREEQNVYLRDLQRELVANAEAYLGQLVEQITTIREALGGLTYQARDMWETLEEHRSDPQTLILANPPRYTGGYDRMFKGIAACFDWDPPEAVQFTETDYDRLMELLGASPATTLMYYATQGEDPSPLWGDPWRAIFADRPGNSRRAAINWIVANRAPIKTVVSRTRLEEGEAAFPLFKGAITPEMTLWAKRTSKPVGDYYRDLFIHKLAGSLSETCAALLVDGELMGIAGLHLASLRGIGGGTQDLDLSEQPAHITFAFTVPHAGYRRLHKLTLMSLASRWFWQDLLGKQAWYTIVGPVRYVQTTMLTPYPENKTARGIMDLIRREEQPDGTYKLTYRTAVVDRTRKETLEQWLNKYGHLTK